MSCACGSARDLLHVSGKTSDLCFVQYGEMEKDGYVPQGLEIGGEDYLEFNICLDCGRVQGTFPIPEENVRKALG